MLIGSPIKLRKEVEVEAEEVPETAPEIQNKPEEAPVPVVQTPIISYVAPNNIATFVDNNTSNSEYYQILRAGDVMPKPVQFVTPRDLVQPQIVYAVSEVETPSTFKRYASAGSLVHVACGEDRPLTPSKFRSGQLKEAWTQTDDKTKRRSVSSSDGGASSARNNSKRRQSNERPKWGANRPTVRYVTQSEKDPFYELRRNGGRRKHRQIRLRRAYEIQQEYSVDGSSEDDQQVHQTTEIVPLVRTSSGLTRKDRLDEQNENQKKKALRSRKWSSGSSSDVILEQLMSGSGVWKNKGIVMRNGWRKVDKGTGGSDDEVKAIERLQIED